MIEGLIQTDLKIIPVEGGDVLHAMKDTDDGYSGFGEAYFSSIESKSIKAWKMHKNMVLNLVVPVGEVKFVFCDKRAGNLEFQEVILSHENYKRLTVPPEIWFGFQGVSDKTSVLLNIANIKHDPDEVDRINIEQIEYDWRNEE